MKKSLLIAGAAIVAVAVPAIAATTQAPPRPHASAMHAPMMKDITRAEVEAKVKEHFAQLDTNKDGVVTKEEISARRDAMRAQWQDERFKALDKDGNGSISRAEFDAGHQARGTKRPDGTPPGAEAGKGGHGARHHGMGGPRAGAMKGGGMMAFHLVDANKDGKVTLAEATSGALAHFDRMDANKDGKVTAQERREGMKQMREEWRKDGSPRRDAPTPPAASKPS